MFLDDVLVKVRAKNRELREQLNREQREIDERLFGKYYSKYYQGIHNKSDEVKSNSQLNTENQVKTNETENNNSTKKLDEVTNNCQVKINENESNNLTQDTDEVINNKVNYQDLDNINSSQEISNKTSQVNTNENQNSKLTQDIDEVINDSEFENQELENNQLKENEIIDWYELNLTIKTILIKQGLDTQEKRKNWFYNFTGYQGNVNKAPDELYIKVYNYLTEFDISDKTSNLLACHVAKISLESQAKTSNLENVNSSQKANEVTNNQTKTNNLKDTNSSQETNEVINSQEIGNKTSQTKTNENENTKSSQEADEVIKDSQINPQNDNQIKSPEGIKEADYQLITNDEKFSRVKDLDSSLNEYQLITNNEQLKEIIKNLAKEKVLAIDTETTGLDPHSHKIRLIQIATNKYPTYLIDCFKCDVNLIQPLLTNDSIKIFHNAKFDLQFFFALGLEVNQSLFDTMLAHQLINSGKNNINSSLKTITKEYLNIELNKDEQISDWVSDTLSDSQLDYATKDAKVLLSLRDKLKQIIVNRNLTKIAKIEFDCIHAIAMMEFNGLLLYEAEWKKILENTLVRKQQLADELKVKLALPNQTNTLFEIKTELNLDSPKQLLEALNYHGIKVNNTNSKTLKKLADNPLVKLLLEYKKLTKIISSFGDSLLKKINPITGRLHGSYWQLGSQSGRLTSSNPNLQQIPRNEETRSCFVATPSHKLIIADYSQIELRIASELTNDKTMISAYNKGEDLHKLTASIVLNKPLDEVTKEDRQIAKSANFGLIYGASVNGFRGYAESNYGINLTEKEAKTIMKIKTPDASRGTYFLVRSN